MTVLKNMYTVLWVKKSVFILVPYLSTPHQPVSDGAFCVRFIQERIKCGHFTDLRSLIVSGAGCYITLPWAQRHKHKVLYRGCWIKYLSLIVWNSVLQICAWVCVYLLYFVYAEVALVTQNGGSIAVLFREQIQPPSQSVHHGQNDGPQEAQNIQDLLNHLTVNFGDTISWVEEWKAMSRWALQSYTKQILWVCLQWKMFLPDSCSSLSSSSSSSKISSSPPTRVVNWSFINKMSKT